MENLVILVMALASGFVIVLPFVSRLWRGTGASEESSIDDSLLEKFKRLNVEKDAIYSTLLEMEFDRKMGKLSETDFKEIEPGYRLRAIELLKEIDLLEDEISYGSAGQADKVQKAARTARRYDDALEELISKAKKAESPKV